MTDKKILTGIIKRLDRVITLLDNGIDTGEFSEGTRRRLVEMLHTSISDIYSVGKQNDESNEVIDTVEVKPVTVIEKTAVVEDVVEDKYEPEVKEEIVAEQVQEDIAEVLKKDEQYFVNQQIQEVELGRRIDDDTLIELESSASLDYFETEKTAEQVIEEVTAEIEPESIVAEQNNAETINADEENLAKEKAQLAELRDQLEDERKRLEEELLSWQKERLKREGEMKAAEQLLAALEAETQKRKAVAEATVVPVSKPIIDIAPSVEAKKPEPKAPPASAPSTNGATSAKTVGDKLTEQRQNLQNSSSSDDLRRQGITPIADLTRAIGINDKFQFIKELFGGDSDKYTDTIRILNNFNNLDEAVSHINAYFDWDKNNDAAKRIVLLVRRRYM